MDHGLYKRYFTFVAMGKIAFVIVTGLEDLSPFYIVTLICCRVVVRTVVQIWYHL